MSSINSWIKVTDLNKVLQWTIGRGVGQCGLKIKSNFFFFFIISSKNLTSIDGMPFACKCWVFVRVPKGCKQFQTSLQPFRNPNENPTFATIASIRRSVRCELDGKSKWEFHYSKLRFAPGVGFIFPYTKQMQRLNFTHHCLQINTTHYWARTKTF